MLAAAAFCAAGLAMTIRPLARPPDAAGPTASLGSAEACRPAAAQQGLQLTAGEAGGAV